MGQFIKVNHSQFENAADAIDTYLSSQKRNMAAAEREVQNLGATWQGTDSKQFQLQWNKVEDNESTSKNMSKALENYANFLRFAASQYKEAQSKAVNRANWL
ncbi:WXG100 family type VII secretion target [Neobacillus drentensis]|uniref:WXG100 family type VII secretion target n=1 Tax=Neobacillus drentensis TaxID=220684 RepID=UPI002FFF3DD0